MFVLYRDYNVHYMAENFGGTNNIDLDAFFLSFLCCLQMIRPVNVLPAGLGTNSTKQLMLIDLPSVKSILLLLMHITYSS